MGMRSRPLRESDIHVTLGPQSGFRGAEMTVHYDGTAVDGRIYQEDRDL